MLSGVYRFPAMDSVVFGKPFAEALAQEVDRVEARAVFILASGTLARETDTVDRLRRMLGNRLAGVCAKIGAHTPRTDVVAAANAARKAGADLIVTLGGGSVTDPAKMVGLCLGNGVTDLDNYRAYIAVDGTTRRPAVNTSGVRSITIPTTLSAGEYTASAGCTDTARHVK
jgi:maleylacetate reductase